MVGVTATAIAVPLGIALELGRRSSLVAFNAVCGSIIGFARGVPLYVMFLPLSILLYYVLPRGMLPGWVLFLSIVVALPSSVCIAEAVRRGYDAIPFGQYEAAAALGMPYGVAMQRVIVPQALRAATQSMAFAAVEIVKDTAIVAFMFGSMNPINRLRGDPDWNGISWELYLVPCLVFWVVCFAIGRYGAYLARRTAAGGAIRA